MLVACRILVKGKLAIWVGGPHQYSAGDYLGLGLTIK